MWTGSKRNEPTKPPLRRVDQLALEILELAAAEAKAGPIKRTTAHRLALAWFIYTDIASLGQAKSFWESLGHTGQYGGPKGEFYRQCDPPMFLAGWKRRIGVI